MAGAMSEEEAGEVAEVAPPHTNGSVGAQEEPGAAAAIAGRRRGRCKWFNVAKGWGFITPDDGGQDVFVHQSVIQMTGFRSLGDEEEVEFECQLSGKGLEATAVTGPQGADCCGSHRRPVSKKRYRKIRCYNCCEFANHIAAKCTMGPQPKRCHHCKSEDHLIADCPTRPERNKKSGAPSVSGEGDQEGEGDPPSNRVPTPSAPAPAAAPAAAPTPSSATAAAAAAAAAAAPAPADSEGAAAESAPPPESSSASVSGGSSPRPQE